MADSLARLLHQVLISTGCDRGEILVALEALGIQNDTDLLLRTDTPKGLEDLQDQLALCAEAPDDLIAQMRKLAQRHRLTAGAFSDTLDEAQSPILFTAPHSIYLQREGFAHHVPEWHTSDLANKFARTVRGAYLTWTQEEEKRNKELFDRTGEPDSSNKDPNFTSVNELLDSPWTREMQTIRKRFGQRPCLHVDLHGCRNPQVNCGSHVVVGLRAMELAGRADVQALRDELQAMLNIVLKGFTVSVEPQTLLTGAWKDDRRTLTQQSLTEEGGSWTHAVQLEMCARLRKALSQSEALQSMLAQGLLIAWVLACRRQDRNGWAAVRSLCTDLLRDWTRRSSQFFSGQDLVSLTKPKKKKKGSQLKNREEKEKEKEKVKASDDSDDEPAPQSGNSEPTGFLCQGPTPEVVERFLARGDEVWSHVRAAARAAAAATGTGAEEALVLEEVAMQLNEGDQSAALVTLLFLAELQLDAKKPVKAMRTALQAAEVASRLQDPERQAEAVRFQVGARLQTEGPDAGLRLVREASSPPSALHDCQAARPVLLLAEADSVAGQGLHRAARRLAREALQASIALGSLRARCQCATGLATLCMAVGDFAPAARVLGDALEASLGAFGELGRLRAGLLRLLAGAQGRLGRSVEAQEAAEQALAWCRRVGDARGEVTSLHTLANAYLDNDAHFEARKTALQAEELAAQMGDEHQRAACLHLVISARVGAGEMQEALAAASELLNLARPLEDVELMTTAMELAVEIYQEANAGSKALLKANAQLRQARNSDNPRLLAAALQWMARAQTAAGQKEEALESAKQARAKLAEVGDKRREVLAYHFVASLFATLGEALQACEEALRLQREMGDDMGIAHTFQLMVELCFQHQDDSTAAAQAEAAGWKQLKVLREVGYKDEEANCLLRLVELAFKAKGPEAALKPARAALALYQELGEKDNEVKAMLATASLYMEDQRLKTALKVAREAQELSRSFGLRRSEAEATLAEARVHLSECEKATEMGSAAKRQTSADAEEACLAAQKIFESLEDTDGMSTSLQLLSHCHLVARKGPQALSAAQEVLALQEQRGNPETVAVAELSVARAHMVLGDAHAAFTSALRAAGILRELPQVDGSCREEAEQLLELLGGAG